MPKEYKEVRIEKDGVVHVKKVEITEEEKKETKSSFGSFLTAVGTYILFVIVSTIIAIFILGGYEAGHYLVDIIRVMIEVLIFSGISSLFMKKKPKGLKPFIAGLVITAISILFLFIMKSLSISFIKVY